MSRVLGSVPSHPLCGKRSCGRLEFRWIHVYMDKEFQRCLCIDLKEWEQSLKISVS